ncbi:SEFIR domain-containing protein [Lentzea sp. NEAU-D7]|uniref:SEFIR domain-containing protein n=1 Tax=Lentzea sp. NEAU-D7 TaxID=2994667 RepID=UPI00224B16F1|nr:SEFIR domain-containing protein [Lentzea sp. NEAU-D7]MCX2954988.1 TIR domain-containing protein [Lentzea sp. NEAU-D7]
MSDSLIKVFVSYAHDSQEHKHAVLTFASLLTRSGIDVELDQWAVGARQDWSAWAIQHMIQSDYVIVVASPQYRRAGDGTAPADVNRGVQSEASILRDLLHSDRAKWLPKLLPVVLPGRTIDEIPMFMQPYTSDHYVIDRITFSGVEDLLRTLTEQPANIRPALGEIPVLAPRPQLLEEPIADPAQMWKLLDRPLHVDWRSEYIDGLGVQHSPTLEVHLTSPQQQTRLQAKRLAAFEDELVDIGRQRRLFTRVEQLEAGASDEIAWAYSATGGIAVHRNGQRGAWTHLPAATIGWVLMQEDVTERLVTMINTLLSLDMPNTGLLAPAVGLEPLNLVRIGSEADLHSTSATLHMTYPPHIRVPAEEALNYGDLEASVTEVADELATRLIARFRKECR